MFNKTTMLIGTFLLGHYLQKKVDTLGLIGDYIEMVPVVGKPVASIYDMIV